MRRADGKVSIRRRMSTDIRWMVAFFALASTPAQAEVFQSDWWEGRFLPMSQQVIDLNGVRISNCHIEFVDLGLLKAVPKCYVLNTSEKKASIRIDFVVKNPQGEAILSVALSRDNLEDMYGDEVNQYVPISRKDFEGQKTGKIRAWVSTK